MKTQKLSLKKRVIENLNPPPKINNSKPFSLHPMCTDVGGRD
jgi:hypothetical protein